MRILFSIKPKLMILFILIAVLFVCHQVSAQLIQDETYKDQSFWKFRIKLENCIVQKDTNLLKSLLAERIYVSKDGCGANGCSKDEFIKYYYSHGGQAELWEEMEKIIRFGFHRIESNKFIYPILREEGGFQAPSYLKKVNTEEEVIILGEFVNIREKPDLNAKIIKQASFEKFHCDCNIITHKETTIQRVEGMDWLEIYLNDSQVGYVAANYTSYFIYKEMTISKVNGEWKIISFYNPPGC